MANAKQELSGFVSEHLTIMCATIEYAHSYLGSNGTPKTIILSRGHREDDLVEFFDKLDFEYDDGYGGQELYGLVWFTDGTWLTRGEYDGSEWWQHHKCPEIPDECLSDVGVIFIEGELNEDEESTELDTWDGDDSHSE